MRKEYNNAYDYRARKEAKPIETGASAFSFDLVLSLIHISMHLQNRMPGTGRDLAYVKEQFQMFRLPRLPILDRPWEEIVTRIVFDGKDVPIVPSAICLLYTSRCV